MLDAQTRAHIDSARDILVGKGPDPESQVEQITMIEELRMVVRELRAKVL